MADLLRPAVSRAIKSTFSSGLESKGAPERHAPKILRIRPYSVISYLHKLPKSLLSDTFFELIYIHQNSFSAETETRTPLGELTTLPRVSSRLGRAVADPGFAKGGSMASARSACLNGGMVAELPAGFRGRAHGEGSGGQAP